MAKSIVEFRDAERRVTEQLKFMHYRGGDLAGYRVFYSSDSGDGPDAIFAADSAHLARLISIMEHWEVRL